MRKATYTVKDIAKLAQVSIGTVDRVIHKRGNVAEETLEKVNRVLNEIDYKPNVLARNLKRNKIFRLAILIPDPTIDPYWGPCLAGTKKAGQEIGLYGVELRLYVFNPYNTKSFTAQAQAVLQDNPDGALLAPLFYRESLQFLNDCGKAGVPIMTFNTSIGEGEVKGFIGQDLYQSGRVAGSLFSEVLKGGEIAIIHFNESYENAIHMQEKERGFRAFLGEPKKGDFNLTSHKFQSPVQGEPGKELRQFMKSAPQVSGIFVTTSQAYQIAKLVAETTNDVVLIGYDLLAENIKYLKQGAINFLIHQNPQTQTYLGITHLAEHLALQKPIQEKKLLPIDIVTSENLEFYLE